MKKYRHVHFIGIKGVAMTALAILAKKQGSKITGSDVKEEFVTNPVLKRFGINWKIGFSKENIEGKPDLVVVTGAHGGMTNPEAIEAKLMGLNAIMQGEALGIYMEGYKQISIAGCHGKTTTSALIATLLVKAGLSPSFVVGAADIPVLHTPAGIGKGKYFIAEADEYATCPLTDKTPKFLWQNPNILVITNIEYDHPDIYQNLDMVKDAFRKFIKKLPPDGLLVAGIDSNNVRKVIKDTNVKCISYGESPEADWQIKRASSTEGITRFWLNYKGRELGEFQIKLPGVHNCLNATAAVIVALESGLNVETIKTILPLFTGTKRRFELITEVNKIKLYDDYAHHPTEITTTLKGARDWFPKNRIICIFQPHTYSRTKALFSEFSKAFQNADIAIITDIYSSAREKETFGISGELLAQEAQKFHSHCLYLKGESDVEKYIEKTAIPGDIIITMGAGDIFRWHKSIISHLTI